MLFLLIHSCNTFLITVSLSIYINFTTLGIYIYIQWINKISGYSSVCGGEGECEGREEEEEEEEEEVGEPGDTWSPSVYAIALFGEAAGENTFLIFSF